MTLPVSPPAGMRDLLYPESTARRSLVERVGSTFESYGYELVTTPPFEHADVLERGLETIDRRDLVRFVEPETGEVALLRPDITPQVARIVATRLADRPPPWRLRYQGTIVRRRRGRARRHRQIAQSGVECIGLHGPDADAEVLSLAAQACEAAGLDTFLLELRQVRLGRRVLGLVPPNLRQDVAEAMGRKDASRLQNLLPGRSHARARTLATTLTGLYGDARVLSEVKKLVRDDQEMEHALGELAEVMDRAVALGLGPRVSVDLGELWGMSYYTGVSFSLLASGPGEPVGVGGRYDDLLARFDVDAPATGFALDLDNLEWALMKTDKPWIGHSPLRIAFAGGHHDDREGIATTLRRQGAVVAALPDRADALSYASAWSYDCILKLRGRQVRATRVADGETRSFDPWLPDQVDSLTTWARGVSCR